MRGHLLLAFRDALGPVVLTWSWCRVTLREELRGRISSSSRLPPGIDNQRSVGPRTPTPLVLPAVSSAPNSTPLPGLLSPQSKEAPSCCPPPSGSPPGSPRQAQGQLPTCTITSK